MYDLLDQELFEGHKLLPNINMMTGICTYYTNNFAVCEEAIFIGSQTGEAGGT